ncbi:CCA tRNA nucleotidyltransferase [Paenibacillus sp. sgz302251]|uniref:CCA tRNA nucleotidyltransferase n=1 Tax=Paenibacillus sp. sgz302251 TaxID=3414493 RepID=UPI003C7AA1D8
MRLSLPESIITALPIVKRLREHHFEAVFVGGCVRDTVLGLPIKDVDIATSAKPEQVMQLFERCIPTGLQHGTITVLAEGISYEVTTFRLESQYEGHRKPEYVEYINSLDGDLLRRDFTMNAMALTEDGELLDPFGGLQDVKHGLLRCVCEADARFQEDALRMLRAVRFMSTYQLRPAHQTWKALVRHRSLLRFIAMERVRDELDKMLSGSCPQRALHFVAASGLLHHLKEPFPKLLVHTIDEALQSSDAVLLFHDLQHLSVNELRWAAIGIGLRLPIMAAEQALNTLRFSKQRSRIILTVISIHYEMLKVTSLNSQAAVRKGWLEVVLRNGVDSARDWLTTVNVMKTSSPAALNKHVTHLEQWLDELPISALKQLSVSGSELVRHLQREAGPWISEMLNKLLLQVAIGALDNDKPELLKQAVIWDKKDNDDEK